MTNDIIQLIAAQRAEFAKAGRLRLAMIGAQLLVAATAVASVFLDEGSGVILLAVAGIGALGTWVVLERRYHRCRDASGRARRAALIMGGLGETVSQTELLSIRETLSVTAAEAQPYEDPDYFASKAPAGRQRLGETLQESAFWTSRLQAASASWMWVAFLGGLVVVALAFVLVVTFEDGAIEEQVARVVIGILTLLMTSDVLGAAVAHRDAAIVVDRIVTRLADAEGRGYPEADLLLILSDYNAVWEATPIALPGLYEAHKDRLEGHFADYQVAREGDHARSS